jgi:hypothetical protein
MEIQNASTELRISHESRDFLKEWNETYLMRIQNYVDLLETEGLDAKVAGMIAQKKKKKYIQ